MPMNITDRQTQAQPWHSFITAIQLTTTLTKAHANLNKAYNYKGNETDDNAVFRQLVSFLTPKPMKIAWD